MVETRRSRILGPDGAPIQIPLLAGETAEPQRQGARAVVYYNEASGLTPARLGEIMRMAAMGHMRSFLTLAIDMEERYLHYCAQLQTRRLALDGVTVSVSSPPGADPKAVDLLQSVIDDPMFPDLVASLQDGVGKGYSVVEPVWEYQQAALRPVLYQHRDPRFFRYDEIGHKDLRLLLDSGLPGEKIAAPYFIRHEPYMRAGQPGRRGLARPVAWAFVMQTFAMQDWAAFCEIYGVPFRLGKYHPGATEAEKATLLRAVRMIANDAAAIVPEGMTIDFQETNGNRGEAVFGNLIGHLDGKVSLLVLGQTLTSDVGKNGGALATAQVHENVRMDIVRFDARSIAGTLNRDLARPMIAMNIGPQDVYPAIQMELAENEDLAALATFIEKTVPMGLRVGQRFVRDRAGIPEPEPDEEVLEPRGAAGDAPAKPRDAPRREIEDRKPDRKARLAAQDDPGDPDDNPDALTAIDDTQALVDDALADWREIRDPLLAGLLSAVGEATDFADALARLEKASIDSKPLINALAKATAKSRGLGDVRD